MSDGGLKHRLQEAIKTAMRAQAKERLGTLRLIHAGIKQREVDERIELNDDQVLTLLDKMIRQRNESIKQFEVANRSDLIDKENFEIGIIQEFLPTPLTQDEVQQLVKTAISELSAQSIRDMGKVMAHLKPKLQGRADMAEVSALIKTLLS